MNLKIGNKHKGRNEGPLTQTLSLKGEGLRAKPENSLAVLKAIGGPHILSLRERD